MRRQISVLSPAGIATQSPAKKRKRESSEDDDCDRIFRTDSALTYEQQLHRTVWDELDMLSTYCVSLLQALMFVLELMWPPGKDQVLVDNFTVCVGFQNEHVSSSLGSTSSHS